MKTGRVTCPHCSGEFKVELALVHSFEDSITSADRVLTVIAKSPKGISHRDLCHRFSRRLTGPQIAEICKELHLAGQIEVEEGPRGGKVYRISDGENSQAFPEFGI